MNNQELLIPNEEQINERMIKAMSIYNNGLITELNDKEYLVKNTYIVQHLYDDVFACTCKDYEYRHVKDCKHILSIYLYLMNGA